MSSLSEEIIIANSLQSVLDEGMERYLCHAYCHAGRADFTYNGGAVGFSAGDCLILPQRYDLLHDLKESSDFRADVIWVNQQFIELCTPQSNYGMRGHLALFNNPVMHLTPAQQEVCILDFDYIIMRMRATSHHFHREAMMNAIQCMIIDFFDFHTELNGQQEAVSTADNDVMQRFLSLLDRGDFRSRRDVGYYADLLNVTPKHLSDVCKRISGQSAIYWINRYTALDISRLLRDKRLSLTEISDLFAFSSMSYFSRFVKIHLGLLPSDFRK